MTVDVALNSVSGINIKVSSNFEFILLDNIRKSLCIRYIISTISWHVVSVFLSKVIFFTKYSSVLCFCSNKNVNVTRPKAVDRGYSGRAVQSKGVHMTSVECTWTRPRTHLASRNKSKFVL